MSAPRLTPFSLPISSMLESLLPVLFAVPIAGRPNSIRNFKIANGPAPSPEEGPPLSASAVRDLSLLWREIVAIVGAYLVLVFLFLGCLLTVGRRLRRGALQSNHTLEMEMLKPLRPSVNTNTLQTPQSPQTTWPSPMSGTESHVWPTSPQKGKNRSFSLPWSRGPTPISRAGSVSTVDENVVRADRVKAQEEMERLYAAVMEHDAAMEAKANENHSPTKSPRQRLPPLEGPPEFRHLRQRQQSYQAHSPVSPMSPLSQELPSPVYSEPQIQHFPQEQHELPQISYHETTDQPQGPASPRSDKPSRLSALSFLSSRSRGPKKLRRDSARNLPISPPILSPEARTPGYPENQPLSPRIYHPGPPPLNPLQQQQHQELRAKPRGPQFEKLRNTSVDTTYSVPPPLHLRSAGSSTSTLPFRVAFNNVPMSAPATKTTIVERRDSILGPMGPRTGIPQTPYSPYMPFTPITPLTPSHMVTRADRKQRKKKNGLQVQTEVDLVMSDEEMWGA
ncbi:hypothetical protein PRK78_003804 [Emydomyces testavorans]|uniref:Uncharacterized protein n=1 Tax=Emydomyces testavorans TaxID=2070801 RepID=A0AAF0DGP8_9EURO|nr:hypothetical protein PRK78_003804 [Emydomyces testavorans]